MGWKDDLKDQLSIDGKKYLLYVNVAPNIAITPTSRRPMIARCEAYFKKNK